MSAEVSADISNMSPPRAAAADEAAQVRRLLKEERGRELRRRLLILAGQIALGAAALAAWEALSGSVLDPFWFSAPSDIGRTLADWFVSGSVWPHVRTTLYRMLAGFAAAAAAAVALGLLLGRLRVLEKILEPYIMALFSLPKVALGPLFIIWFGLGFKSSFMMVVAMVFFPVFYSVLNGVRAADAHLIDMARIMGASRRQLAAKIILPAAKPWIFAGLKLAVPYAIIGAVIGEMLGANRGLGFLVQYHSGQFNSTGVFAALFILTAIALALELVSKHGGNALRRLLPKK